MVSPRRPTQAHSRLRLMRITADLSALIGINLRKSSSPSVGAREVRSGGEGLDGRPRPGPCAHLWRNALTPPAPGDHQGLVKIPRIFLALPHIIRPRPYGPSGLLSLFQAEVDAYCTADLSALRGCDDIGI